MKDLNQEILKEMNGTEVWAMRYDACVGIKGNQVISEGQVVDILDTDEKVEYLFQQVCQEEGISRWELEVYGEE